MRLRGTLQTTYALGPLIRYRQKKRLVKHVLSLNLQAFLWHPLSQVQHCGMLPTARLSYLFLHYAEC